MRNDRSGVVRRGFEGAQMLGECGDGMDCGDVDMRVVSGLVRQGCGVSSERWVWTGILERSGCDERVCEGVGMGSGVLANGGIVGVASGVGWMWCG